MLKWMCLGLLIGGSALASAHAQQASPVQTERDKPSVIAASDLTIVDARSEKSKTYANVLSYIVTDCEFGVTRLSDDFGPDKIASLRRDLFEAFGAGIAGKSIVVSRYDIHFGGSVPTICPLPVCAIRPDPNDVQSGKIVTVPHCSHDKMAAGWFDPADLTKNGYPIVVEETVVIDGREFLVNSAYSRTNFRSNRGAASKPANQAEVAEAMAKANKRLVDQIADLGLAPLVSSASDN